MRDDSHDRNGNAWTVETLRLHLLAIMDEREKAIDARLAAHRAFITSLIAIVSVVVAAVTLLLLILKR